MAVKPQDPFGGHVRIYWTLLDCPAYLALGYSARALYVDLRRKLSANNNGNIECTLSTMKHRGWRSSATLFKALHDLQAVGLIAQTRRGGIGFMSKVCSLYRFTDLPVWEHPKIGVSAMKATHDYSAFQNKAQARASMRMRAPKKEKVQKMKLQGSTSEAVRHFKASETEQEAPRRLEKLKPPANSRKSGKAMILAA